MPVVTNEEVLAAIVSLKIEVQRIAEALEKRVAFRRAMKQAVGRSMKAGAQGVKVQLSGRLGGNEIARSERNFQGKVPLHTLRADIDYALTEASTAAGIIGVKVWVYRGEILPGGEEPNITGAEKGN